MPRQPTVPEIRLNDTVTCLEPAVSLLNDLHDALGTPFVPAISTITLSLIIAVRNAKQNKAECTELLESIAQILYAIVNLHIKSETTGSIAPAMLHHVGKFTETLHKIHTFADAQKGANRIKSFFRQGEMSSLLKDCREGLKQATEVFKIESELAILEDVGVMQQTADNMHRELLQLISNLPDDGSSMVASSAYTRGNSSSYQASSNSLFILPAKPKIFHGRQAELAETVAILNQDSARIAILGPGGIGKTSLAKAVMHHPDIAAKYESRYFVPCDSASTALEVAALIAAHLDLRPGRDLRKPVLQSLVKKTSSLLILDNLETAWDPTDTRSTIEELLSQLTDLPHLALIITMRGAQRPAKVRWTRPFLPPLTPLSPEAAKQTFEDITDDCHDPTIIGQLLSLTDNMPLAVSLIAHLVDYEDSSSVLARWNTEKTTMLSAGSSRGSDMDVSIRLSLSSPRLTSAPGAMDLLSLLSLLPDGLSDRELIQSQLPINSILACKTVLLGTSLAYTDDKRRLKSLVPIREYMQKYHPPAQSLVQALLNHLHMMLNLYAIYQGSNQADLVTQITPNLGNLQQLLLQGLNSNNPNLKPIIACTISLNTFNLAIGCGRIGLMDHILPLLQPEDHVLHVQFVTGIFRSLLEQPIPNHEALASQAISHLKHVEDLVLHASFYRVLGYFYTYRDNLAKGVQTLVKALEVAKSARNIDEQGRILNMLASAKWSVAEYAAGLALVIEARRLLQLSGNFQEEAKSLWIEAGFHRKFGAYQYSLLLLWRARERLRLCDTHMLKSEYAEAKKIHVTIAQNTSPEQDMLRHAYALLGIAQIDITLGTTGNDVEHTLSSAKMMLSHMVYDAGVKECEMSIANLHLAEGDLLAAKPVFQTCLQWSWGKEAEVSSYCLEQMADIRRWKLANLSWCTSYLVVYLAFAQRSRHKHALHLALQYLGELFLLKGYESDAENLFIVALEGFTSMDVHRNRADCMLRLGQIMEKRGDLEKAETLWMDARPLFERSLQEKEVAGLNTRLAVLREAKTKSNIGEDLLIEYLSMQDESNDHSEGK
ncbi:ATPase-AAA-core domain-containing protein [Mycena sanguinolenta]|uniref:ATPase-AAA-core domain-containing protein n=1 Tax=Mycena sanguinolenta TaxID=230812 RepID=A0A8H7CY01_9AGAR|nr:ATPase-AAA-core domain-containing protein [Mycena sanguinolenta]